MIAIKPLKFCRIFRWKASRHLRGGSTAIPVHWPIPRAALPSMGCRQIGHRGHFAARRLWPAAHHDAPSAKPKLKTTEVPSKASSASAQTGCMCMIDLHPAGHELIAHRPMGVNYGYRNIMSIRFS